MSPSRFGPGMIIEQALYAEINRVLQQAYLPISMDELVDAIIWSGQLDFDVNPSKFYSPYKRYLIGDRLFHPSERSLQWFRVEAPYRSKTFRAVFDNGEVRTLRQNAPISDKFTFIAHTIEEWLSNLIHGWKDGWVDIVEVGELFVSRPVAAKIPFDKLSNPVALIELANMRLSCRGRERTAELRELCRQYKLMRLYYLTPLNNLASILENGILAKNVSPEGHASFANEEIQAKRHRITPNKRLSMTLHDFVPLFFAARPPLLYALREQHQQIAYLVINPRVLLSAGATFSPTNATSTPVFY